MMSRVVVGLLVAALVLLPGRSLLADDNREPATFKAVPPEIKGGTEWINTRVPVSLQESRGKVVVLFFWTYGCINCQRNTPHYVKWAREFKNDDVVFVCVHTPEVPAEYEIPKVKAHIENAGFNFPVVIDNEKSIWNAWDNRWWPSTYLVDRNGFCRYRWDGELNWQKQEGEQKMKTKIEELLKEPFDPQAIEKAAKEAAKPTKKTKSRKKNNEARDN